MKQYFGTLNYMVSRKMRRGFTLIELLVVVAIIGLLASVVLASLGGARESARDAQRQSDIRQIQTAIELYINANGEPPLAGVDAWHQTSRGNWDELAEELEPYISPLPVDPVDEDTGGTNPLVYTYRAGGSDSTNECQFSYPENSYELLVRFEGEDVNPGNMSPRVESRNEYCLVQ